MFVKRNIENNLLGYINSHDAHAPTLLISGARQVGKTTLVRETLKKSKTLLLNLAERVTLPKLIDQTDSFDAFERLLWREFNFRPSHDVILVIDEAQESKRLGRWVRFFKEKWTHQKVIILGSILSRLFEEEIPYPVGRVEELVVRPFNFKEYLTAMGREGLREVVTTVSFDRPLSSEDKQALIQPYLDYLQTGGMPEIVMKNLAGAESVSLAWDKLLRQYALDIERYLGEDFRNLFISALDRIAETTCHPVKNSQIVSTDSPSYRKVPQILTVMEKWHLLHRIAAQTRHPESGSGMASKRFIFDVGLTHFFINKGLELCWKERSDVGNLIYPKLQENFVCNELIASEKSLLPVIHYYRENRNSREIDFILSDSVPIEVKSQSSVGRNSLLPIVHFLTQRNLKTGILVYNGEMKKIPIKGKSIHAIPPFLAGEIARLLPAHDVLP